MDKYANLKTASIEKKYLITNSTTHEVLFGALAEIVDNSRDAGATNLNIYTRECDGFMSGVSLNFIDDGCGMDPEEASNVISFGCSKKNFDDDYIGQYGNGLKSGSMRIGQDLIVFTKKNSVGTIIFISRTFLNSENISSIKTPMPSFSLDNHRKEPYYPNKSASSVSEADVETHQLELDVIIKYSPYKSKRELMEQFDQIAGDSGTLVTIFNLNVNVQGVPELDFLSDPTDIWMANVRVTHEDQAQLAHKSFREYVSILYLNPKMKIYIQNKKVITRRLDRTLYRPISYQYSSNKFKAAAEKAREEAEHEYKLAVDEERNAQSQYAHQREQMQMKKITDKELTKYRRALEDAKSNIENKKRVLEIKKRNVKEHKTLTFTFGVNLENRDADGLFIYNCHRLILMFTETKEQRNDKDLRGIVGVVDIPYTIFKPMHNKQSFQDKVGITSLIKTIGEYLECYSRYLNVTLNKDFWGQYGYVPGSQGPPTLPDPLYRKKRMSAVRPVIQCSQCLKWRMVPFQSRYLNEPQFPPDDWNCEQNPDTNFNRCDIPETLDQFKIEEFKVKQSNLRDVEAQLQIEHERNRERERAERERTLSQYGSQKFVSLVQKENQTTKKITPVYDTPLTNGGTNKKRTATFLERSTSQLDDYAYASDPDEPEPEPCEPESDDSRDRNYLPGRSSQSKKSDKSRSAKRVCKDTNNLSQPTSTSNGRSSQTNGGTQASRSQEYPRRSTSTTSSTGNTQEDVVDAEMDEMTNINLKMESLSQTDLTVIPATERATSTNSIIQELTSRLVEAEEKRRESDALRRELEQYKESFGSSLKSLLAFLVQDIGLESNPERITGLNDQGLSNFKVNDFIEMAQKRRRQQIKEISKNQFRKCLEESKGNIAEIIKKVASKSDTAPTVNEVLTTLNHKFKDISKSTQ